MTAKKINILLTANEAFVKDFGKVLELPTAALERFLGHMKPAKGFVIDDDEALLQEVGELGVGPQAVSDVYSALKHLFTQAVKREVTTEDLMAELDEFCQSKEIAGLSERRQLIAQLLTPDQKYLEKNSVLPFAAGVVPDLHSISGVVDIRTAFADRNSTQIIGYVPVVQIRLTTTDSGLDDNPKRVFPFQMTERGLKQLQKNLKTYADQLQALKAEIEGKVPLVDLATVEDSETE